MLVFTRDIPSAPSLVRNLRGDSTSKAFRTGVRFPVTGCVPLKSVELNTQTIVDL